MTWVKNARITHVGEDGKLVKIEEVMDLHIYRGPARPRLEPLPAPAWQVWLLSLGLVACGLAGIAALYLLVIGHFLTGASTIVLAVLSLYVLVDLFRTFERNAMLEAEERARNTPLSPVPTTPEPAVAPGIDLTGVHLVCVLPGRATTEMVLDG